MEAEQDAETPDAYRRALMINPADGRAAGNLLIHLFQTGQLDEAREVCRKFHGAGGVHAGIAINAIHIFSSILYDEDGIELAASVLERARRRYPEDAVLWLTSYWLASIQHDYRSAISYAAKAASLDPRTSFQCLWINTPLSA